jgi:hypothetical protein
MEICDLGWVNNNLQITATPEKNHLAALGYLRTTKVLCS